MADVDFNYGVFYSVEGQRVMVHAILDLRQDPVAIRRRLDRRDGDRVQNCGSATLPPE